VIRDHWNEPRRTLYHRSLPLHASGRDVATGVRDGAGAVRGTDTDRGILAAEDDRPGTPLPTALPPADAEHEPVRRHSQQREFEPTTHS
jgi:hypothetical protein